jgi:hypothetical protein
MHDLPAYIWTFQRNNNSFYATPDGVVINEYLARRPATSNQVEAGAKAHFKTSDSQGAGRECPE